MICVQFKENILSSWFDTWKKDEHASRLHFVVVMSLQKPCSQSKVDQAGHLTGVAQEMAVLILNMASEPWY